MDVGDLPKLSAVLSSMNHYDHFDVRSFAAYRDPAVPFLTIAGSPQTELARDAGFSNVVPVAAGSSAQVANMTLHAFAANEFSPAVFRYEQSYVIEAGGRTILFSPHFPKAAAIAAIKARFGRIDIALLGVNGLRIKPLLGRQLSMDPEDAARVCAALGVSLAIPIHYAFNGGWVSTTFLLTHKGTPERFAEATRAITPHTATITLSSGQSLVVKRAG
jgi:L-ascorbate metabolism protein UlaG (beta-lactamase superfamily)